MDLLRFYARFFVDLSVNLMTLKTELKMWEESLIVDMFGMKRYWARAQETWGPILNFGKDECEKRQLTLSARHCKEIYVLLHDKSLRSEHVESLIGTISRELQSQIFLSVRDGRREFYSNPTKDWERSIERFPDAQEDIEEMNKCFALSRYSASVFHSLLVVEHGLIALGHHIGVTDPKPGWDATYKRLSWLINNRASMPPDLNYDFLEQTKVRLDSMKHAWRNKVNHAAGKLVIERTGFSDVSAEEVIVACRSFMRHLAEGLQKG
ncbi:MAG TPA: hypothetical protein VH351_10850 [Bryobacteraceae bacterium]|nr:hypothetical protein [Bryobacteraceae bacterium]